MGLVREAENHWNGRSVLVTGASGLVGSWMVPALVARGAAVTVLVRDTVPGQLPSDGIRVVQGSLSNGDMLRRTMAECAIQTVFHLGAQTVVGVSKADATGTLESNVRGTWNVLEAARQNKVRQTLIASTMFVAATEALPGQPGIMLPPPRSAYEISKVCTERIAHMYAHTYGTPVGIVRCGNLYGGCDLNFSRLIPGAVRATLRGERFQFRSDGSLMRDFLYVEDAVAAYLLLAQKIAEDPSPVIRTVSFGLGRRYSLLETVGMIARLAGREDIPPIVGDSPGTEISEEAMDNGPARNQLGWAPQFGIEEGLSRTIEWFRGHLGEAIHAAPALVEQVDRRERLVQ